LRLKCNLYRYIMVYMCTLPFILVHEVGVLAVVPTTALLSLALFGTEAAAEQIEQPFGNRPYHLPVGLCTLTQVDT
jgi:predicted membrane chloride channel (bestrophin family)